ncbi:MAG: TonB-dependent receptor [Acidobacteria bacterium]|nr:TonB-dependent receptor [Acidobacteriota bacterium]
MKRVPVLSRPFCLLFLLLFPALLAVAQGSGQVYGRVRTLGADGEPIYLTGAHVLLVSTTDPALRLETQSDDTGAFEFKDVPTGTYRLTAQLEGYEEGGEEVRVEAGVLQEVTVTLRLAAVKEEVEVRAEGPGIRPEQTAPETELAGAVYQNAPVVSERFLEALPLVPGVVRGPDGLMKLKGARTTQTGWLVNSTNVTDPVTGEQAINLPVDVIEEVEVLPNPYSAEYGKFAGAVTSIETKPSTDKFGFSLNNFVPRLRRREGSFRGVEAWTPRITFSGPLVKGKLTFLQSFEYRLTRTPVLSLPELEQDIDIESFDSFTQFDITVNDNHTLTPVFSLYPQKNRFATMNTFNPEPVTANYRQRGWMGGVRDRHIFGDGSLLESTISVKDYDVDVFAAGTGGVFEPPLHCAVGPFSASTVGTYVLRPTCNFGSFFNTQNRVSRRTEWLETYSLRPREAHGQHLVRVGFAVSRDNFRGFHHSRRVEVRRNDDTLAERIEFIGEPEIARDKTEVTLWLQDKWSVVRRLTLDVGVRYDYDTLAGDHHLAPRAGFAWLLTDDNRTLLRAGIGLFYDKVPLNVGTFPQLEQRVVTLFDTDGMTVVDGPRTFVNALPSMRNPYSVAFNVELDRELTPNLLLRLGYLQREGRDEYIIEPFPSLVGVPTLLLAARGRSRYREYQATANYRFREDSFLNVSYVHSESAGDLNNFQEYFGNFENPIIRENARSRLRFDVPDRLLVWGEIETFWGIRWAPVLDIHSGFAFSLMDETRNFVGARNHGGRLPTFASFDAQLTRDFRIKVSGKKRRLRVGIRVFNILNHHNPRDVQENIDAFNALELYNSRDRIYRGKFSLEF